MNKIKSAVLLAVAVVGTNAMAAAPVLTTLTSEIDFSTVSAAILAIASLLAAVYVTIKGVKIVMSMVKGG